MVRMRSAGRGWMRRPARPRSRLRRLWDWLLTFAILGLLILLAARLDRTETRSLAGRVTVNDGDSITLGTERIRLRGIDAPEFDQHCRKDGADYPCGRRARDALVKLDRRPAGLVLRLGARQIRPAARDMHRRRRRTQPAPGRGGLGGRLWSIRSEEEAARDKGAGLWAGSFERPRDWREMHGGHGRKRARNIRQNPQLAASDASIFVMQALYVCS